MNKYIRIWLGNTAPEDTDLLWVKLFEGGIHYYNYVSGSWVETTPIYN